MMAEKRRNDIEHDKWVSPLVKLVDKTDKTGLTPSQKDLESSKQFWYSSAELPS